MSIENSTSEGAVGFWKSAWNDIADNYKSAWAFAFICPLLFLIPVVVEMYQHFIEMNIGMYDSIEKALTVEKSAERLNAGFLKTIALLLPGYWFARYVISGRDAAYARNFAWPAVGMWGGVFIVQSLFQYWTLMGPNISELLGLEGNEGLAAGALFQILIVIFGIYMTIWFVSLALGNGKIGPVISIRTMKGSFWRAILYMMASVLPLMIVHYALGIAAIRFEMSLWMVSIVLALDSFIVGILALTIAGSAAFVARHAADKSGLKLMA